VFEKSQSPKTTTGLIQNCLSPRRNGVFVRLHTKSTVNYIKTECWQKLAGMNGQWEAVAETPAASELM
jgi:hypothetical protein